METRSPFSGGPSTVGGRWCDLFVPLFQDFVAEPDGEAAPPAAPAVKVREDASSFCVTAELPGLGKRDVEVEVGEGVLVLRGMRSRERDATPGKATRTERRCGPFFRAIALPDAVDETKVVASFKDGVLAVRLSKRRRSGPKEMSNRGA